MEIWESKIINKGSTTDQRCINNTRIFVHLRACCWWQDAPTAELREAQVSRHPITFNIFNVFTKIEIYRHVNAANARYTWAHVCSVDLRLTLLTLTTTHLHLQSCLGVHNIYIYILYICIYIYMYVLQLSWQGFMTSKWLSHSTTITMSLGWSPKYPCNLLPTFLVLRTCGQARPSSVISKSQPQARDTCGRPTALGNHSDRVAPWCSRHYAHIKCRQKVGLEEAPQNRTLPWTPHHNADVEKKSKGGLPWGLKLVMCPCAGKNKRITTLSI